MTERCPACERPACACPVCNGSGIAQGRGYPKTCHHCREALITQLRAQVDMARKCIEAADEMRTNWSANNLTRHPLPAQYDRARAEFDKVTLDGGESKP